MRSAVRGSSMALRLLWIINLALGIYIAFITTSPAAGLVNTHMLTGILIVALLWFLGIAQALRGGPLVITVITFVVGLALPIIGMAQLAVADGTGALYGLQGLHVILALTAIALGEMCAARFNKAVAVQG
jgi:hypothetical protein